MTQDPAGRPTGTIALSKRAIGCLVVVVIVIVAGVVVAWVSTHHSAPPSQPVAGPTSHTPNPSPTDSRSHSPSPPVAHLELQNTHFVTAQTLPASGGSPAAVNVGVPTVYNAGSAAGQFDIWVTLPGGSTAKFDSNPFDIGGVLDKSQLSCIGSSAHPGGYTCNVPPHQQWIPSGSLQYPGQLQSGTVLNIQLPGEPHPRSFRL